MDPAAFFESAIPFFICRGFAAFMSSHGVIHFSVEGSGAWTVQLGNLDEPITRGLVGTPDLAVWYSARAFQSFLDGTMKPREVIRAGEFIASGNVRLLEALGKVLAAPRGPLGIRVGLA
jgi:hypothetical protein